MLSLAEHELVISPEQFDADPMLLNAFNGTLNLRTGQLQPHRREDYLMKIAPVEYDPRAPAPTWEAFLDRIFEGNRAVISFMQRLTLLWRDFCRLSARSGRHATGHWRDRE
jgi:putative DNA primase/helicase